ncbi:hypothetical protein CQR48_1003 [Bifidobacterium thermophilum]|uniref:hypothetical protein n=1 Tax=Bifidobacterium thermophilum TaxID=33905 RepID=UPI000C700F10|nr:hypothetical protein [Bifidobacterium thermophilum]PKU89293.1 hypothetical protein CQR48_1003 [Bifidobacterium thermophilum]
MNTLTIPQKLEALQAVVGNPDIGRYDIPYHFYVDEIIDDRTPCRPTERGQALWERFTKHLNTGYKKLTTGERLFWLTTYTGENQPDDTQLLDIIRTSTSSEVREAAATHYAAHHHEHDVTDKWRHVIADILRGVDQDSATLAEIVAPIADEQLIRDTEDGKVVAAWLDTHPEASDDIIHHWLIDGWDGVVGATIQSIDPTRLPHIDIPEILDAPHSLSEWTRTSFASVSRHLTVPQLETLLDRGIATVTDMLIYSGPFTDEQWRLFDKRNHEAVETALWEYRRHVRALWKESSRLFTDPTGGFATKVEESCLKPKEQEQKADGWTTM